MAVLSRLASLLMSATPNSKKRRGKQPQLEQQHRQQQQAIDLCAGEGSSHAGKRSRSVSSLSPAKQPTAAPDACRVVDLTGSASPAVPAQATGGAASQAAENPAQAHPSATPAAAADQSHAGHGSGGSGTESKAKRCASQAAAGAEAAAAASRLGAGPGHSDSEGSMFSRLRGQAAAPETNGSAPGDELPAWHSMQGAKRLQAELKYLNKQIAAGKVTQMHDLTPVGDNIFKWQFKLKDFDNDCEGGMRLNEDLSVLSAMHGQDHLLMEISFPKDYPHAPFFLRMVTPRCVWYSGHVTAGGSVCIEVLTQSGTPNSWAPGMCVESIMNTVIQNMLHVESVIVRTATGPGGVSGPLRVDLEGRYSYSVMAPYSEHEAKAAFSRMLSHHKHNGW